MRTTVTGPILPVTLVSQGADGSYSAGGGADSRQYTTATTSIATSDGTVGTITTGGKMTLQNCGTAAVYVKRGTGASSSSFNWILSACSAQDDGLGGSCEIDDYVGAISIDGVATPRVAVTLFS